MNSHFINTMHTQTNQVPENGTKTVPNKEES